MPYHVSAFPIARLRAFPGWPTDDQPDDAVVFVHPDGSVRADSLPGSEAIVWAGDATFRAFCREALGLEPTG